MPSEPIVLSTDEVFSCKFDAWRCYYLILNRSIFSKDMDKSIVSPFF